MKKISIIVPCYNEEQAIPFFYEEINKVSISLKYDFEFIFVNDGSKDQTIEIIKKYAKSDKRVKFINFSRNFGKEAAMLAGLKLSSGDYVAIMDADLQDPPSLLPEMISILTDKSTDYDCVGTRRVTRKGEPPIRSFFARMFYKIINRISDVEIVDGARDYRMMPRKMVEAIVSMKEVNRFSKGLFSFVGFKTRYIEFENVQRAKGETKWSFWKLFMYSVEGIVSFSTVPLSIASYIGTLTCIGAFAYLLFIFIKTILYGDPVKGYPSMMCVILFLGGIQLIALGILGQYLARTYSEVKHRPIYIVREEK